MQTSSKLSHFDSQIFIVAVNEAQLVETFSLGGENWDQNQLQTED